MNKLGYFLGGVLAGAVTLGVVAWYVAEHDSDACGSGRDDDEDDGCLKSAATMEEANLEEEEEAEDAAQPA